MGCEIHFPTYSGVCAMSYGRLWQLEGGALVPDTDRHLNLILDMDEDHVWRPYGDQPKLFNESSRGTMRDYSYRMEDGSLCSWVDGLMWIDAALPRWQYDWSANDTYLSFCDTGVSFTSVSWTLLCAEFQLGERAIECLVLRCYELDYQRFICQRSDVINKAH